MVGYKVSFKSTPENYRKEYSGLKRNTVRKKSMEEEDVRFEILDKFIENNINHLKIEICNSINNECFSKQVTDVTKFDGYYIISWAL